MKSPKGFLSINEKILYYQQENKVHRDVANFFKIDPIKDEKYPMSVKIQSYCIISKNIKSNNPKQHFLLSLHF